MAKEQMEDALRNLLRGMDAEERGEFMIGAETHPDVQTVVEIAQVCAEVDREQQP